MLFTDASRSDCLTSAAPTDETKPAAAVQLGWRRNVAFQKARLRSALPLSAELPLSFCSSVSDALDEAARPLLQPVCAPLQSPDSFSSVLRAVCVCAILTRISLALIGLGFLAAIPHQIEPWGPCDSEAITIVFSLN